MNKSRTGINSGLLTNNVSNRCGGIKKAGLVNTATFPTIPFGVIAPRLVTKMPETCVSSKTTHKIYIKYSY